jgi:hypothetical protein
VAQSQDVDLLKNLEILNPAEIRAEYVRPLFELRKHKGLSMEMAASQLEDNVVLGTMMIAFGEADGLVSGAVHSTANTIRPALQIVNGVMPSGVAKWLTECRRRSLASRINGQTSTLEYRHQASVDNLGRIPLPRQT